MPGHTPAILEEIPVMVCDGLRGSAMLLDASKSQQNGPLYRIMWQGLYSENEADLLGRMLLLISQVILGGDVALSVENL